MKLLIAVILALGLAGPAYAQIPTSAPVTSIQVVKNRSQCTGWNAPEGALCYATKADAWYKRTGAAWLPDSPRGIEWSMSFDKGASKGLTSVKFDGTAYTTTADAVNILTYGYPPIRFQFTTNTTATGTVTPAAEANGIDLNAGSPGNNDEWTATFGGIGSTGGPAVIGTTPAFAACATLKIHDVSGSDGLWLMVSTPGAPVDLSSADPNYTSYCAIGSMSGNIYVSDNTTGGTDTTQDWADDESHALCVLVSAAGACTYTIDGAAPTVTDAHTLGDGLNEVMRIQGINDSDIMDDTWLSAASFSLQ